jgi:prepilin-type N-terminal cleavage/methylation domain-containing protein
LHAPAPRLRGNGQPLNELPVPADYRTTDMSAVSSFDTPHPKSARPRAGDVSRSRHIAGMCVRLRIRHALAGVNRAAPKTGRPTPQMPWCRPGIAKRRSGTLTFCTSFSDGMALATPRPDDMTAPRFQNVPKIRRGRHTPAGPPEVAVRHTRGFTILELIFVMALVAVVSSITIPMAQSAVATYRLESSSVVMATKIRQARSEALRRNRPVWLLLDKTAHSARIQTSAAGGGVTNLGGIEMLPGTVGFTGFLGATAQIQFDSAGRLANAPQTVRLRSERLGTVKVLTILVTGRVTVT